MSDLRTALKGEDKAQIEKKTEALAQASSGIAQRAAQAERAPVLPELRPGAQPAAPAGARDEVAGGENVVDAEFEEVKDPGRKAS